MQRPEGHFPAPGTRRHKRDLTDQGGQRPQLGLHDIQLREDPFVDVAAHDFEALIAAGAQARCLGFHAPAAPTRPDG